MIETVIKINGMACSMCEAHINDTIRQKFNVKKVTSSHAKGETVVLSERPLDESALRAAIEATGYEFISADFHPVPEKKGLFGKLFG